MDFGEVLSKSWKIIWKHKILWIFGILGGCSGGSFDYRFSSRTTVQNVQIPGYEEFVRFLQNIPVWVWVLLFIAGLVLTIVLAVINTIGRIGLIKGAVEVDEGAASLPFGSLFSASLGYFWRIFLLNLLAGLAVFFVVMAMVVLVTAFGILTLGIGLLCFIPLICVLIPLSWALSLIIQQSSIAIVAENKGIIDGLSRGWQVVINNLGYMVVMALILLIGGGIAGFLIGLPVTIILFPLFVALAFNEQIASGAFVISLVILVLYLPVLLVAGGILRSYIVSAWTLTFRRLAGKSPAPVPSSPFEVTPPGNAPSV